MRISDRCGWVPKGVVVSGWHMNDLFITLKPLLRPLQWLNCATTNNIVLMRNIRCGACQQSSEGYNRWRGFVVVRCIYVWAYSSTMCVLVCGTSLKNRTTVWSDAMRSKRCARIYGTKEQQQMKISKCRITINWCGRTIQFWSRMVSGGVCLMLWLGLIIQFFELLSYPGTLVLIDYATTRNILRVGPTMNID